MEDTQNFDTLYSRAQTLTLQIIPLFTAPLSAIGSALIIYSVLVHRKREMSTYHRLMLGMSVMDFICSMGMTVFGHWAVPRGTEFVIGARGNNATCQASFFFVNFLFGSMLYTISLVLYFVLVVRFNWPKRRITRFVEPVFHFFSTVPTLVGGIVVAVEGDAAPMYILPGFCFPTEGPLGCPESGNCGTTTNAQLSLLYVLLFFVVMIVCMALLFHQARKTDQFVERYHVGPQGRPEATATVAREALLYIASFFLVFCPVVAISYFEEIDVSSLDRQACFAVAFLTKLLTPLQGLFNAIIFLRGRLLAFAQQDEGRISLDLFVAYLNASGNLHARNDNGVSES